MKGNIGYEAAKLAREHFTNRYDLSMTGMRLFSVSQEYGGISDIMWTMLISDEADDDSEVPMGVHKERYDKYCAFLKGRGNLQPCKPDDPASTSG